MHPSSNDRRRGLASLTAIASAALLFGTGSAGAQTLPAGSQGTTNGAAQPTDASAATGGDIVVTAQKRQQSLRDVSASITALGTAAIGDIAHQDVTALVMKVPGLQVQQFSPTTVAFNIRGVSQNDFADSQEAPIAFYNDEVYVSALAAISGQNFDLERIEVLRGPQGTLFGRNATGGLVQYITAKPTRTPEADATLTFGSYGEIASDAAVSGPLSDRVRARLSFSSDHYDGYITNRVGPDVGSRNFYAGRAQLETDVGSGGLIRVKLQVMRNVNETSAPYTWLSAQPNADGLGVATPGKPDNSGYIEPDNNPFTASFDNVPYFNRTYWSATTRYEQDLGSGIQLTSITDYEQLRKRYGEDSDGTPFNLFNYYQHQALEQASQEVRLSGKLDRLHWLAGVYGLYVHSNALATIDAPAFATTITAGGPQSTRSFAIFGQGDYKLLDTLTFTLGARYSYDDKRDSYVHSANGAVDLIFNQSNSDLARQVYRNWSGKAGLEYRPVHDTMFYVSVNRGTKSGGFDIPNFPATDASGAYIPTIFSTIPYKQEVLTNYEGGFKISLADRRVDINGAGFQYDYQNYQAFIFQGLSAVINNLPAAVTGAEGELSIRPTHQLNASLFVTYLDTVVRNVQLPGGRVTDRQLPQAPTWSYGGSLSWTLPVGRGSLTTSTDWRYDGASYFSTFNAPIDLEPGHLVGSAHVRYRIGHWSAALIVNNISNKWYRVYDLDNSPTLGSAQATFAHPRWFGGSIGYTL